ncbi:MAG: glycosyltransferase [Pseudomonadota bacterium]
MNRNEIEAPWLHALAPMRRFWPGLEWQPGVLRVPIRRSDVLVLSGQPRTLSTLALILKAKFVGAKIIWWGHYWTATSKPWRATIRLSITRLADAILYYTDQEVKEYSTRYGASNDKLIRGLNNGIEVEDIKALRELYSFNKRPRDLLFVGRITPKAELGLMLKALSHQLCSDVTLDVIGDGEELAMLRDEANRLGISDRIVWHGAITDEARIAEIANTCKAFVYPGAVGLSLVHALSYGLPAIVHDNRWQQMPEIAALRPGENGVTFEQGNVVALAESTADLLACPEVLSEMSAHSVLTTEHSFNASDMTQRLIAMIDELE